MELFVSTTAPLSPFASARRRTSPAVAAVAAVHVRRRCLPARGWRCGSAAVPDPVPSEEPASAYASTVLVTEKPAAAAEEEKSGAVEPTVEAAPVSSEASEVDGGLDDILSKLDIEITPTYVLYGTGAFVALWILSSVVSAIDSVPLLPKLLELVGIGYSIWFTARNLLFKENRDELFAKFEDLKGRIV